jgi:hypothetical protein
MPFVVVDIARAKVIEIQRPEPLAHGRVVGKHQQQIRHVIGVTGRLETLPRIELREQNVSAIHSTLTDFRPSCFPLSTLNAMRDRENHEPRSKKRAQRAACRKTSASFEREPELEEVIVDLERRLTEIEPITTRDYDDRLAVVEALAAPYAIAFLYEIRRLDDVLVDTER